jgi:hypothetical protein
MKRPVQMPLLAAPRCAGLSRSQREMLRRAGSILSVQQRIAERRRRERTELARENRSA